MTTVYLSSTYSDLKAYREAVYHVLRQMHYDVKAVEDYVAADQRPLKKCIEDVTTCDLYVGLFAWHYGYIPDHENPEHKSITELEYRQAKKLGKPCLIFLLDEDASWSAKSMDSHTKEGKQGKLITDLRQKLQRDNLVSFFTDSDHLARMVGPAVYVWKRPLERGCSLLIF